MSFFALRDFIVPYQKTRGTNEDDRKASVQLRTEANCLLYSGILINQLKDAKYLNYVTFPVFFLAGFHICRVVYKHYLLYLN